MVINGDVEALMLFIKFFDELGTLVTELLSGMGLLNVTELLRGIGLLKVFEALSTGGLLNGMGFDGTALLTTGGLDGIGFGNGCGLLAFLEELMKTVLLRAERENACREL